MNLSRALHWVRRRTTTATATALTLAWAWTAAGVSILWIVVTIVVLVLAAIRLRRHRDARWSVLLAGFSALVLAGWAIAVMGTPTAAAQELAAALTGCALAAPAPTLTAWLWQPRLVRPLPPALLGTAAIGTTAAIAALTGTTGWVPAVLLAQILAGAAAGGVRQRGAAAHLIDTLGSTDFGWHELLSSDSQILYRRGAVILAVPANTTEPGQATRSRAVMTAALVAASMHLPLSRVQPVLTHRNANGVRRIPTTVGNMTAQVILTRPDQLDQVAAGATVHLCTRRPLLRIAHTTEVSSRA